MINIIAAKDIYERGEKEEEEEISVIDGEPAIAELEATVSISFLLRNSKVSESL